MGPPLPLLTFSCTRLASAARALVERGAKVAEELLAELVQEMEENAKSLSDAGELFLTRSLCDLAQCTTYQTPLRHTP